MLQKIALHQKKKNKGFTLVELVVVIAILAILAAIAVPQLIGFTDRARQQADNQTAAQVKNAVALLWANGELVNAAEVEFTLDAAAGVATITNYTDGEFKTKGGTNIAGTGLADLIEELVKGINIVSTTRTINVTVGVNGNVESVLE